MKEAIYDIFCLFYYQFKKFEIEFAEEKVPNANKFNEEARRWTLQFASMF